MLPRTLASTTPAAALFSLLVFALTIFSLPAAAQTHQDLIRLFDEWRAFERPVFVDGVPDYSVDAMSQQHEEVVDGGGLAGVDCRLDLARRCYPLSLDSDSRII